MCKPRNKPFQGVCSFASALRCQAWLHCILCCQPTVHVRMFGSKHWTLGLVALLAGHLAHSTALVRCSRQENQGVKWLGGYGVANQPLLAGCRSCVDVGIGSNEVAAEVVAAMNDVGQLAVTAV